MKHWTDQYTVWTKDRTARRPSWRLRGWCNTRAEAESDAFIFRGSKGLTGAIVCEPGVTPSLLGLKTRAVTPARVRSIETRRADR